MHGTPWVRRMSSSTCQKRLRFVAVMMMMMKRAPQLASVDAFVPSRQNVWVVTTTAVHQQVNRDGMLKSRSWKQRGRAAQTVMLSSSSRHQDFANKRTLGASSNRVDILPKTLPFLSKWAVSMLLAFVTIFSSSCDHYAASAADMSTARLEQSTRTTTISSTTNLKTNIALIDYAVGTINTQYYDNSGGAWFNPQDFYLQWRNLQRMAVAEQADVVSPATFPFTDTNTRGSLKTAPTSLHSTHGIPREALHLETREGTVQALKWLVGSLQDPYSKYMTRDELQYEYHGAHDGFLGTGAFVEAPSLTRSGMNDRFVSIHHHVVFSPSDSAKVPSATINQPHYHNRHRHPERLLSCTRVANLPVVTAVAPNSPAERAGLVVGDRIVAIGDRDFLGWTRNDIAKVLRLHHSYENKYFGVADLTIAKPMYAVPQLTTQEGQRLLTASFGSGTQRNIDYPNSVLLETSSLSHPTSLVETSTDLPKNVVLGYRVTKLYLPTKATEPSSLAWPRSSHASFASTGDAKATVASGMNTINSHGDALVQYKLLTSSSESIFFHRHSSDVGPVDYKVGYLRLTRFSKLATEGFQKAVRALDEAGAQSYIIDLRNNYGGFIQEAMLTASSLLRDPHAILCYTLNARGGFTPVDVEQYVVDPRYPGYLMSNEPKNAVLQQIHREHPSMFQNGKVDWDPPSSYASIHEQVMKRGIRRVSYMQDESTSQQQQHQASISSNNLFANPALRHEVLHRKDLVLLINEGTASSADFFVAALHDNRRSVAVVGTKSFGKGLIQHTFPMPDGGGLKLTVGEFLRPSLQHVTSVFDARYDYETGEISGGGIRPDVYCDSNQGIPGNPEADLCVGVALDVLEESAPTATTFRDISHWR